MMQENFEEVALEIADRLKAARENWEYTADLDASLTRLLESRGETPTDALAALAYCGALIGAKNLENLPVDAREQCADMALVMLVKATDILERQTGRKATEFLGCKGPGKLWEN
ncbi:hypothetical protein [Brucella pituitosa]|uniref:Uncharacterized protein n=1 Tax=Brucella pituitosa TaxID=571256 RepID=A0A643EZ55_9HYPH|nr:hypothetical protein [Brucella pituitosa]KAB0571085.1 hypothetical protein F7Q93_14065 [Brucella pituitosa]